ncbi:heat shock 70 kDa protein 12A-like isoform X2 [Argopecten irradians]|uniref:heat shock 70 kDa protein 12A-like isoform X2 n=1 Tax=Argopecten irradians TaxID=31199 RepID=UPI003721AA85
MSTDIDTPRHISEAHEVGEQTHLQEENESGTRERLGISENVFPEEGDTTPDPTGTDKPIVAAIDFGTTYSGYAYTFRSEYEKSAGAREIFSNRWAPNMGSLMSAKAPTTALFEPDMTFHSFGYEAEEKYADLIQEKQQRDWHCFKRFKMKLHDKMAGIQSDCLTLALEPEAASLFCKSLPHGTLRDSKDQIVIGAFQPGGRYMIVDMGGGTVDTTVHEVAEDGRLVEIRQASGGPWGGISVDETFYNFVADRFGREFIEQFKRTKTNDWLALFMEFEIKKRQLKHNSENKIGIKIPPRLIAESNIRVDDLTSYDKIRVENEDFKTFFHPSIDDIIGHVRTVLNDVDGVNTIVLVGGFSQSDYVTSLMKSAFSDERIVIPLQAEMAVLHGAVLFGFEPRAVSARICRHTYGISCRKDFMEGVHLEEYRKVVDGKEKCLNMFSPIVTRGERVTLSATRENKYSSSHQSEARRFKQIGFPIFASTSVSPTYTTEDSCIRLGQIVVNPPENGWPPLVNYRVETYFGRTEFKVKVINDVNGAEFNSSFDFLA